MRLMFPSNPMNPREIDEFFLPQAEALAKGGYALFSQEEQKVLRVGSGDTVVYRGWMLDLFEYRKMKVMVEEKGGEMLTSVVEYLNTHHIPFWYPLLHDLTAETHIIPNQKLNSDDFNLVQELKSLGWEKFLLKDYVKSLKTHGGSVTTPDDAPAVVELMKQFRGTIEGGLCVRKFEELHDEQRYFVVKGGSWHRVASPAFRDTDRDLLSTVADRIHSPFFSVDVAINAEGKPRVVEVGDGQVSDLVGWTPEAFAELVFKDLEVLA